MKIKASLTILYVQTISLLRIKNVLLLILSYYISILIRRPILWGKPMAVSIEPLNICNLKCPECPTGVDILTRAKGKINISNYEKILSSFDKSLWHINLYFQGEPFIHPQFIELVKKAKQANLVVETSTNAQFLTKEYAEKIVESGLDILVVSLDGTSQEIYEQYRVGGDMQKVISGVEYLVEAKKQSNSTTPIINLQFLAFNHNEHQINDFKKLAKRIGADCFDIKKAQIYNADTKTNMLPNNKSLSRYQQTASGSVQLKGKIRNNCYKHWSSAVITWQGNVVPCCFDKDANYNMGNMLSLPFSDIWKDEKFNMFRHKVLTEQEKIDICNNCPLSRF